MLTNLQTTKITQLFHVHDLNGNGVLELGDFERIARNLAKAAGAPEGSAQREAILGQYRAAWQKLAVLADSSGDKKLTLEEWLTAYGRLVHSKADFEAIVGLTANLVFEAVDLDRDGVVGGEEYQRFVDAYQIKDVSPRAFARLDTDGDGRLSYEDVVKLVGEFYQSDDPAAPGNALFGRA